MKMAHKSFPCPQTEVKQPYQKNKVLTWRTAVILEKVYAEMMNAWVEKLRLQYCDGCKFNNPSQQRHACLMNSQEEAWNEFYDEAQQRIDPKEIIAITSQIMDCPLTDSWMKYVEALRKLSWWNHYATFQEMYRSLSQDGRLIYEKVWQAVENKKKKILLPPYNRRVFGESRWSVRLWITTHRNLCKLMTQLRR